MKHDVAMTISTRIVAIVGLAMAFLPGVVQNVPVSAQEDSQSRPETRPTIDQAAVDEFLDVPSPELLQQWPGCCHVVLLAGFVEVELAGKPGRIHYTCVTIASLAFVWFSGFWI